MNFLVGLAVGLASIFLFLLSGFPGKVPVPTVRGIAPPLSFEQQVRKAQDVTATGSEDEEEEAPPRSFHRRGPVSDEEDERISMEKNYQPPDHWKWKYESQRNVVCEYIDDFDQEVCHTNFERPIYRRDGGRPRRDPDQRMVRHGPVIPARMPPRSPCRGGCPYYGN